MAAQNDGDAITAGQTNKCADGTELIVDLNKSKEGNDYLLQVASINSQAETVAFTGVRAFGNIGVHGIAGLNGNGVKGDGGATGAYFTGAGPMFPRGGPVDGVGGIGVYGFGDNMGTGVHGVGDVGVVGASGVPNWPGPFAVPTLGPSGTGVFGLGVTGDGVSGRSEANRKSGVFGFNGSQQGPAYGLFGLCNSPQGTGVCGSSSGTGAAGVSTNGAGVIGTTQTSVGVLGESIGEGIGRIGVHGRTPKPGAIGVYGEALEGFGVVGAASGVGFSGWFLGGPVLVLHDLIVTGAKSAAVVHADGSHRRFFSVESPDSWFEDFGEAELTDGRAEVRIDPEFAYLVDAGHYHVFLSPYGEAAGIHVAQRHREGFEVLAKGAKGTIKFSYRVVAKRKDVKHERLAKIKLPPSPEASSISTERLRDLPSPPSAEHVHRSDR